eukprot:NODE_226_length_3347_cov_6.824534.p1 GENE.NODE_226_length_3347_cov_6.824534~~NODE_226_length_3347_cov_6.824534.p1  ORF type:complete len:991 (+),score=237.22 NODE_226_length_3347_cov_6.824534:38-3010(+)
MAEDPSPATLPPPSGLTPSVGATATPATIKRGSNRRRANGHSESGAVPAEASSSNRDGVHPSLLHGDFIAALQHFEATLKAELHRHHEALLLRLLADRSTLDSLSDLNRNVSFHSESGGSTYGSRVQRNFNFGSNRQRASNRRLRKSPTLISPAKPATAGWFTMAGAGTAHNLQLLEQRSLPLPENMLQKGPTKPETPPISPGSIGCFDAAANGAALTPPRPFSPSRLRGASTPHEASPRFEGLGDAATLASALNLEPEWSLCEGALANLPHISSVAPPSASRGPRAPYESTDCITPTFGAESLDDIGNRALGTGRSADMSWSLAEGTVANAPNVTIMAAPSASSGSPRREARVSAHELGLPSPMRAAAGCTDGGSWSCGSSVGIPPALFMQSSATSVPSRLSEAMGDLSSIADDMLLDIVPVRSDSTNSSSSASGTVDKSGSGTVDKSGSGAVEPCGKLADMEGDSAARVSNSGSSTAAADVTVMSSMPAQRTATNVSIALNPSLVTSSGESPPRTPEHCETQLGWWSGAVTSMMNVAPCVDDVQFNVRGSLVKLLDGQLEERRQRGALVDSHIFTIITTLAIIANTVYLSIDADQSISNNLSRLQGAPTEAQTYGIVYGFCLFFIVEIMLRIAVERTQFVTGPNRYWNAFDSFIVISSSAESLLILTRGDSLGAMNISELRVFRVFRLLRLLHTLRNFTIMRSLNAMVDGVKNCFAPLFWFTMMLVIVIYTVAICTSSAVIAYLERHDPGEDEDVIALLSDKYNSTYSISSVLFESITGGADWAELALPLKSMHEIYYVMFGMYIVLVTFGVLNIVTGFFVDNTLQNSMDTREQFVRDAESMKERTLDTIRQMFYIMDSDSSGRLSLSELERSMTDPNIQKYFSIVGMEDCEATALFDLLDYDRSNEVIIDDFVAGMMRIKGEIKNIDICSILFQCKRNQHVLGELVGMVHAIAAKLDPYPFIGLTPGAGMLDKHVKLDRPTSSEESR